MLIRYDLAVTFALGTIGRRGNEEYFYVLEKDSEMGAVRVFARWEGMKRLETSRYFLYDGNLDLLLRSMDHICKVVLDFSKKLSGHNVGVSAGWVDGDAFLIFYQSGRSENCHLYDTL